MLTPADIIKTLHLEPLHPEGGFFRETYRSTHSTAIYYLLTPETFSALHQIPGDEIYHFYLGDPVEMLQLYPDGSGKTFILGSDLRKNMNPQLIVPSGVWQGSRLVQGGKFALLGTTMAPGFQYSDYKTGERKILMDLYPSFANLIESLTHKN